MPNTHPAVEISSGARVSHPITDTIVIFRWVLLQESCGEGTETSFDGFYKADKGLLPWPVFTFFLF